MLRTQLNSLMILYRQISYGRRNMGVVLMTYNTAVIRDLPFPEVKGNEVLVKMGYVQLGRADLQVSTIGKLRGEDLLEKHKGKPIVLGSYGTGTVLQLGPDVLGDVEPGDRVVLEPRVHCGHCLACEERRYYMCKNLMEVGIPPRNGMLQHYFTHPWHLCHKLPDEVGLREGSYCTTVACCLQAYKASRATPKSRIVVIGAGMAGACLVKIFSSLGVKSIVVIDVFKNVLGGMKKLGANYVLNTKVIFPPIAVVDEIVQYCNEGWKPDIILDTVQSWATAKLVAEIIKSQGTVVLFDHPSNPTTFNYIRYMDATTKILDIVELKSYGKEFRNAIHFLKKHQNLCDYIPPYEVPLERGIDGLTIARSKLSNKPCVIITC